MEKIILKKEKQPKSTLPVFIDIELMDQLKEIKDESGIPVRKIAEKCIRFGLENLEIVEGED